MFVLVYVQSLCFFFSAVAFVGLDWKKFKKPSISDPMAF